MAPALLITSLEDLPTRGVAAFVRDLALRHGVSTTRTALDAWADKITELCGDDVSLDDTAQRLASLKRASVISGAQMARLLVSHLREKKAHAA